MVRRSEGANRAREFEDECLAHPVDEGFERVERTLERRANRDEETGIRQSSELVIEQEVPTHQTA